MQLGFKRVSKPLTEETMTRRAVSEEFRDVVALCLATCMTPVATSHGDDGVAGPPREKRRCAAQWQE